MKPINMKKRTLKLNRVITAIALLFSLVTYSQDREYKFAAFAFTDPGAMKTDGFSIGAGIEYQMNHLYFKAQSFSFPDLRGKTYTDLIGTPLGFNQFIGFWDNVRIYEGLMLGLIFRDGYTFPTVGGEIGIDFNVNDTVYLGIGANYILRQDGKVWEANAVDYWRGSGMFKVGFRW